MAERQRLRPSAWLRGAVVGTGGAPGRGVLLCSRGVGGGGSGEGAVCGSQLVQVTSAWMEPRKHQRPVSQSDHASGGGRSWPEAWEDARSEGARGRGAEAPSSC